MIKLLEAINRGILRGLNELNIELISDLDDDELDLLDSILTKSVNNKIKATYYTYFPKTKNELINIIIAEVDNYGWNCDLNHIDVSKITDMSYLFSRDYKGYTLENFNGDISGWDVSNVTDMECMFSGAKSFNQPIGNWDVSNVTNMEGMFYFAESFNQPIDKWSVSNVENMRGMFNRAYSFNQTIGDWDVSNVTDISYMFQFAESFNQDLSNWKLNTNCNTDNMFYDCPIKKEYKPKV